MSLYRRANSPHWWCEFQLAGKRVRLSTGTANRQSAEEFETLARARAYNQLRLGHRPPVAWKDAAQRWLAETTKRSKSKDEEIIHWLTEELGPGAIVQNITLEVVQALRVSKREATSESTADRYMALLRAILRKCADDWQLVESVPKVPMYRPEAKEPRWLTGAQFDRLQKELPDHLKPAAEFAVLTGLRMRSQLGLRWSQIDLKARRAWVAGAQMKGKRALGIPLSRDAVALLRKIPRLEDEDHVFLFRGKPFSDANGAAWREACKRAGLAGLRWHDLRHTWASWAVQAGVSLHEVMQLGGWRSLTMVMRYSHLSPDHLTAAADRVRLARKSPHRGRKRA